MQVLLYLEACKLHIYNFFRTRGFPIFDIFREPFMLVPEVVSVGAKPKKEQSCFALSKFLNPSVAIIPT